MSKKSSKSKGKLNPAILQIAEDAPLAKRTKKEEKQHQKIKEVTRELNEDAWVKVVKLMKGEWDPFPQYRRCHVQMKLNKQWGVGVHQHLLLHFKRAVLSQNWTNAIRLALAIFKNPQTHSERIHLQVFLTILMGHPKVNEQLLSNTCSFLWKMEREDAMMELLRCFCSMPKELPSEFLVQFKNRRVVVRAQRDFKDKKSNIQIRYTAHIGKSSDNDMYIA